MGLFDCSVNSQDQQLQEDVITPQQQAGLKPSICSYNLQDENYASIGYNQAIENKANPDAYQLMLRHLLCSIEIETRDARDYTRREAKELQQELENLGAEQVKLKKENLPCLKLMYQQIEQRHDEVMRDPSKLHEGEKTYDKTKMNVWLAGTIAVSLFLYIFYFLIAHAAFIRNIGKTLQTVDAGSVSVLFESVFDSSAIARDFIESPANLLICLFFPPVFMSIGYLFHELLERRKHFFAWGCLMVIVGLDATLAYKVTSKMHEARFLSGLTDDKWRFNMIFSDVNFYMILLSGLAIYILWGKLLTLYFEEKKNCDRVSTFLADCREKMKRIQADINFAEDQLAKIEQNVREKKLRATQLDEPAVVTIVPWYKIEHAIDSFSAGWARGIAKYYKGELDRISNAEKTRSGDLHIMVTAFKQSIKNAFDEQKVRR